MSSVNVIGIVGGMGPEAGASLFDCILRQSGATKDQHHLPVILISMPGMINDRTEFLRGNNLENPAFGVIQIIQKLYSAGASVIGIACNTCHAPPIISVINTAILKMNLNVKLVDMPFETSQHVLKQPDITRVGLMATIGTYYSQIYQQHLYNSDITTVEIPPEFQENVIHRLIYDPEIGLKANAGKITPEAKGLIDIAFNFFSNNGADAIILGCTELSTINTRSYRNLKIFDSTEILADALIRDARQPNTIPLLNDTRF